MKFLKSDDDEDKVLIVNISHSLTRRKMTMMKFQLSQPPLKPMMVASTPSVLAKATHKPRLCGAVPFVSLFVIVITLVNLLVPTTIFKGCALLVDAQHVLNPNVLQPPIFTKTMDSLNVRENTPVNEVIYTLEAELEPHVQGVRILYDIEETQLFSLVDRSSGQVRVAQPIDREISGDSVTFQVVATPYLLNRPGAAARLRITVYILDENDNAPRFERVKVGRQEYDSVALARQSRQSQSRVASQNLLANAKTVPLVRLNVSEDTQVESVIVDLIAATDLDKASSNPLSAICLDCDPEFKLTPITTSLLNDRLDWSIVLAKQLVHVPRNNLRVLNVIVSDGKFNTSIQFEITVDDVQNKPPHFISSTTSVVQENTPIDRTVLTIQAVDGDALAMDDGPIWPTSWLSSSSSQANKSLSHANYGGRQIIYDFVDQATGQSASRQADFKLHPLTGQLQVSSRLDRETYLDTEGVLFLQVRARELTVDAETVVATAGDDLYDSILLKLTSFIDQAQSSVTISEISIIITDVNDNAPRWLNGSEIARMNQSPVWYQNLPTDRDTGRLYQIKVRENSLAGSPIGNKNEMFVYDLDAGDNAEFIIKLEDPFNLFDVEPKRISGFSSVTLKLANNNQTNKRPMQQLLDYENVNERNYIIQLFAIESKTNEQFKSKAQIQIVVVDVNDNSPEFKELAYAANVREDAPAGKMVKLVQANDRDEISKQLTYSLHGQSAYLFEINSRSGMITVAKCDQFMSQSWPLQQQQQQQHRRFATATSVSQQQRPCIDFETQRTHHLMVEASDGELSSKVPLTIYVEDASDNAPIFALPIVDVVIEEGAERLDPPIRVEAIDVDQSSTLSYSIIEGNFEGFFAINNVTGELQLTRAIRIPHDDLSSTSHSAPALPQMANARGQQQLNKMSLIVQASDGVHTVNGTIRIDILDANDNAPQFSRPSYEKDITESFAPGQSVLTVRAFDQDRGNNARVSFRIERGSFSQFDINELTGEISVGLQARPFDTSKRDNYTLEVVAYDHGLISKSSSVIVAIRVLSTTKRAPEFSPQIQRETISESTLNNTVVHRMLIVELGTALEPVHTVVVAPAAETGQNRLQQTQQHNNGPLAVLMFEPGPIEGLDKYGQPVTDIERLESMFSVATNTGDVVVNSGLNHDFAAYINLTVYVSYRSLVASAPTSSSSAYDLISSGSSVALTGGETVEEQYRPKSVGYLIINIMDDNDNAPIFAAPWSPNRPELLFQMPEELPVGSILTQLVASDADSKISHYEIDPPNEYFELLSAQSGTIVNKKVIDYDTLMRQTFLSPSSHRPGQTTAAATLLSTPGSAMNSGSATAALMQQFASNNIIQFNVIVYDSGLRQLSAKAIVSVEILPINDNDCKFELQIYEANINENARADTVVTQVRASDADFGEQHSSISYSLLGDQRDLFNIDSRTGIVSVSHRGSVGLDREQLAQPVILLTVVGRELEEFATTTNNSDLNSNSLRFSSSTNRLGGMQTTKSTSGRSATTCSTTLRIRVDDVNDNPPLFAQKIYEVTAYDTDSIDVPLVKLIVHDEDLKHNFNNQTTLSGKTQLQQVTSNNFFRILSGNLNDSFNITQSGMIYVTKALNESFALRGIGSGTGFTGHTVELRVQVRQQSQGSNMVPTTLFTDECLVRVHIMKINRFAPEWRLDSVKRAAVDEDAKPGTLVTQLKCIDRDYDSKQDYLAKASQTQKNSGQTQASRRQTTGNINSQHQQQSKAPQLSDELTEPSPIRYWIKVNGTNVLESGQFKLDPFNGRLVTRVELDREERELYHLIVSCEDNGKPQSLESITSLYIVILDVDDNKPEFVVANNQQQHSTNGFAGDRSASSQHTTTALSIGVKNFINFVVEEQQSKGLQVGELKAIDRDLESKFPISFCLLEGNEFQEFLLDQVTGTLYTNQTLDREKQAAYDLLVKAINDGLTCEDHLAMLTPSANLVTNTTASSSKRQQRNLPPFSTNNFNLQDKSLVRVRINVLDINDNAPVFKRQTYRAGVHHRALLNTLVTQVPAFDPDHETNGTLNYKISEILLYKTNPTTSSHHHHQHTRLTDEPSSKHILSKPIKLIQSPFKIDQQGNIYTQQLLTQYQLMSMFVVYIEATETSEPWRTASTKLEIYVYETNSQLKITIKLHPRLVEAHRFEIETRLSNATKFTAVINRARSYNGNNNNIDQISANQLSSLSRSPDTISNTIDLSSLHHQNQENGRHLSVQSSQSPSSSSSSFNDYLATIGSSTNNLFEPHTSNILVIFVDNYRIVNPSLVMEKFDLTSAQLLFTPQSLNQQQLLTGTTTLPQNQSGPKQSERHEPMTAASQSQNELSFLLDKVEFVSSIQTAELQMANPSSLVGIDWLESSSMLYVCLTTLLTLIGVLICLIGCCCTSRIKDHIIKVAMDKLVKQQSLQAKINERVMAATNQVYAANSVFGGNRNGAADFHQSTGTLPGANGNDIILNQNGFMSSFDATKGCLSNNYENMSILQRAMEAGEFIDPNYTTLNNNGHLNMGAHYYDASELEGQQQQNTSNLGELHKVSGKPSNQLTANGIVLDNSVVSLSLGDEEDEDEVAECSAIEHDFNLSTIANNGDLSTNEGTQQHLMKSSKLYTNGANGIVSSQSSRMRQQIPNGSRGNNNININLH